MVVIVMGTLLALSAGQGYASTVYDLSSCISYWKAEGNATDSKGANNATLVNGTTFATGKVGQAFSLDGVNDYVQVGTTSSLKTNAFTLTGWFYKTDTQSATLFSNSIWTHYYGYALRADTTLGWMIQSSTQAAYVSSGTYTLSSWHFFAADYDASADKFDVWLDGVKTSTTTALNIQYESTVFDIGYFPNNASNIFKGSIDEVAFWNTRLTDDQITAAYRMGLVGGGAVNTLGFNYTTNQIGQLTDLYAAANPNQSVTMDGITWHYVSSTPGTHNIGDAYTDSGKYYIKLGSGLEGDPAPEPATVVGMGAGILLILRRTRKHKIRNPKP
jgi:hypothetical protein